MPHAVNVMSAASLSPTPWGCFAENADITGCGKNTKCELPTFWSFKVEIDFFLCLFLVQVDRSASSLYFEIRNVRDKSVYNVDKVNGVLI